LGAGQEACELPQKWLDSGSFREGFVGTIVFFSFKKIFFPYGKMKTRNLISYFALVIFGDGVS
jgi:hypothetical protein